MPDSKFENLWSSLAAKFATSAPTVATASTRAVVLQGALANDAMAVHLSAGGWVHSTAPDGRMHITCPFADTHTTDGAGSSTTYFPANTGGYATGHFKCLHAHCESATQAAFAAGVGYAEDFFIDLPDDHPITERKPTGDKFAITPLSEFSGRASLGWIIKGVLPRAELGVIVGTSGAGKSFFMFDMLCHIAQGASWRGRRTKQTDCLYIASEGATGFRDRARAYAEYSGVPLKSLPIGVIGNAPDLRAPSDIKALIAAIASYGALPGLIVVDTLAASMPGGNENSGVDVGVVLGHCKALHRVTGAMIVLIHHAGKDAEKGSRGWSGLPCAADCEISVIRDGDNRAAIITKLKDGDDTQGNTYGFKLEVVQLGTDSDGDPVTSCVTVAVDLPINVGRGKSLDTLQLLVMSMVNDVCAFGLGSVVDLEGSVLAQLAPPEGVDNRVRKIRTAIAALVHAKVLDVTDGVVSVVKKE